MEVITSGDSQMSESDDMQVDHSLWEQAAGDGPHAETVTVTLTQNPGEGMADGHRATTHTKCCHKCIAS